MDSIKWSNLNNLQIGAYSEAYAKMLFQSFLFQTYSSDVDDRGVDFIAEIKDVFYKIQVKSIRGNGYVFMRKEHFHLDPTMLLFLLRFRDEHDPEAYIIPATEWKQPNSLLVNHEYGNGKKSKPEWGVNLSAKNDSILRKYSPENFFDSIE